MTFPTSLMVTAFSDMAEIRAAMRRGAWDYVLKDGLCEELLLPIIETARTRQRLENEVLALRARTAGAEVPGLIGTSTVMERLRAQIRRVAVSDRPVLVTGLATGAPGPLCMAGTVYLSEDVPWAPRSAFVSLVDCHLARAAVVGHDMPENLVLRRGWSRDRLARASHEREPAARAARAARPPRSSGAGGGAG